MTKLPDMQRAVNDVDGVAAATMRWPEPEGPAFIRIEFEAEADQGVVTERVLEVLRHAGGTDMAGLVHSRGATARAEDGEPAHVNGADKGLGTEAEAGSHPADSEQPAAAERPAAAEPAAADRGPSGAATTAPGVDWQPVGGGAPPSGEPEAALNGWAGPAVTPGSAPDPTTADDVRRTPTHTRPVLERISIERTRLDATLEVTLDLGGRRVDGRGVASSGARSYDRVAAEATLGAVAQLLPGTVRLDLQEVATTEQGPTPTAHVWLSLVGPGRQEDAVGSAIVRLELADAVARATLDAVNRWLPALLDDGPLAGVSGNVSARRHTTAASE